MSNERKIPAGLCQCGCGTQTKLARDANLKTGQIKGEPFRFAPGHSKRRPFIERWQSLLDRVEIAENGCWIWTRTRDSDGYGKFSIAYADGTNESLVHRIAYRYLVGPIPKGCELDHVKARGCTNRACINPDHLEPVPHRINLLRSEGMGAVNAAKTHCVNGHPFDEKNTQWRSGGGGRACRECHKLRSRRKRGSRLAENPPSL